MPAWQEERGCKALRKPCSWTRESPTISWQKCFSSLMYPQNQVRINEDLNMLSFAFNCPLFLRTLHSTSTELFGRRRREAHAVEQVHITSLHKTTTAQNTASMFSQSNNWPRLKVRLKQEEKEDLFHTEETCGTLYYCPRYVWLQIAQLESAGDLSYATYCQCTLDTAPRWKSAECLSWAHQGNGQGLQQRRTETFFLAIVGIFSKQANLP